MSAIRPNGTTKMAADSRNAVTTQLSMISSVPGNSRPMEMSAMLIEDERNGVIKADIEVMRSISRLSVTFAMVFIRDMSFLVLFL